MTRVHRRLSLKRLAASEHNLNKSMLLLVSVSIPQGADRMLSQRPAEIDEKDRSTTLSRGSALRDLNPESPVTDSL
jgi:hypothetical protein